MGASGLLTSPDRILILTKHNITSWKQPHNPKNGGQGKNRSSEGRIHGLIVADWGESQGIPVGSSRNHTMGNLLLLTRLMGLLSTEDACNFPWVRFPVKMAVEHTRLSVPLLKAKLTGTKRVRWQQNSKC